MIKAAQCLNFLSCPYTTFFPKSKALMAEHEEHVKHVEALKVLEQKENQFHQNINLINDMRRVILYRYCNK